jgi:hypothetical protein
MLYRWLHLQVERRTPSTYSYNLLLVGRGVNTTLQNYTPDADATYRDGCPCAVQILYMHWQGVRALPPSRLFFK